MQGVHVARRIICSYLEANLPRFVQEVRNREDLPLGFLPDPKLYEAGPFVDVREARLLPAVWVDSPVDNLVERTLTEPGPSPVYEIRYRIFVTWWLEIGQTRKKEAIELDVDRMATAIEECLTDRPSCGDETIKVYDSTFRRRVGDPWQQNNRWLMDGRLDFEVDQVEQLVRPPVWTDPTGPPVVIEELL